MQHRLSVDVGKFPPLDRQQRQISLFESVHVVRRPADVVIDAPVPATAVGFKVSIHLPFGSVLGLNVSEFQSESNRQFSGRRSRVMAIGVT